MPANRKMTQTVKFGKHLVEKNKKNENIGKKELAAACDNLALNSWNKSGTGSAASKLMSGTPKDRRVLYWSEKTSIYDHFSIV